MLKRTFDLLVSATALLVLALPLLLIAGCIRFDSPGPALYRQVRVGRHGRHFRIHKFRTMQVGADQGGAELTLAQDARITRLGRFLRAHRIDELPQLIDVLHGHMSLVGPRPEVPRYVEHYPTDLRHIVLSVRPGITDTASLAHRDDDELLRHAADPERHYTDVLLPRKLQRQAQAIEQSSFLNDLRVLLATARVLLGGRTPQASPSRALWPAARLLADAGLIALCWQVTYLFRLGFDRWLSARPPYDLAVLLGLVALYTLMLSALRVPAAEWRHTGFADIRRVALACLCAGVLGAVVTAGVLQLAKVPRAVLALHPFVSIMGLCAARLAMRMVAEHLQARRQPALHPPRRALVLGAGEAARRLIAGIQGQGWQVLGLLDDDPAKQGVRVAQTPVLGPIDSLPRWSAQLQPSHLILALPSVRGHARRRLIEAASATGLPILTVPSAEELRQGSQASRIRDVEPDDLLGRDPAPLDDADLARLVEGQVVAVTGAGGSIGSELCLQLTHWRPAHLLLLDHSEFALYRIEQRLIERFPGLSLSARLVDVKDEAALGMVMEEQKPRLVLHAAAYKHVPLVESENAWAALRNNVWGTWVAARAAARCGAQRFVLISTDKAVNPTNVMGATKRAAEIIMATLAQARPTTRFIAVRFGNVLGSTGSVIPRFKRQIAAGGPVTVTHPDVIRYFMTIPEACRLVLHAAEMGQSGEVLILDMGEPMRIADLARSMIRLSGLQPEEMPIVYTGLRPGEKLFEELTGPQEPTRPTRMPAIRAASLQALDGPGLQAWIEEARGLDPLQGDAVRRHLNRLVPEYRPQAAGQPKPGG